MAVHFSNPETQAQADQWVSQTGRPLDELVEDVMAGYFEEQARKRQMLDSRYDGFKSGKVKMIPGDVVMAEMRQRIAERRSKRS